MNFQRLSKGIKNKQALIGRFEPSSIFLTQENR